MVSHDTAIWSYKLKSGNWICYASVSFHLFPMPCKVIVKHWAVLKVCEPKMRCQKKCVSQSLKKQSPFLCVCAHFVRCSARNKFTQQGSDVQGDDEDEGRLHVAQNWTLETENILGHPRLMGIAATYCNDGFVSLNDVGWPSHLTQDSEAGTWDYCQSNCHLSIHCIFGAVSGMFGECHSQEPLIVLRVPHVPSAATSILDSTGRTLLHVSSSAVQTPNDPRLGQTQKLPWATNSQCSPASIELRQLLMLSWSWFQRCGDFS